MTDPDWIFLPDVLGAVGSIALLLPPARDVRNRYRSAHGRSEGKRSPFGILREALTEGEKVRTEFSQWDIIWLLAGAFALGLSFLVKLALEWPGIPLPV